MHEWVSSRRRKGFRKAILVYLEEENIATILNRTSS
jgi:hypothetical protein